MRYCSNCGSVVPEDKQFCTSCGTVQAEEKEKVTENPKEKKPLPLARIISISIVVFLVIAAVIGHFLIKKAYPANQVFTDFEEAVESEDYKKMADILNDGQKEVKVKEKDAELYIEFLDDQIGMDSVQEYLKESSLKLDNGKTTEALNDDQDNKLLIAEKGKKKFFFYEQYNLKFYPIEVKVASPYENTDIFIKNKKAATLQNENDFKSIGFFLPGSYTLKSVHKNKYSELSNEEELTFEDAIGNELEFEIDLADEFVTLYSNDDDAILYVNGKSTDQTISDVVELGPIPFDGSVVLHAERKVDGVIEKTETVEVVSDTVELYFEEREEDSSEKTIVSTDYDQNAIEQYMLNFYHLNVQAINRGDFSLASHLYDPNGKAYGEMEAYVDQLYSKGTSEEVHDVRLVSFEPMGAGYHVTTKEHYTIYYNSGKESVKYFQTKYFATVIAGELKINELIQTDEISGF